MKPVAFDYARPETLEEALDLMAEYGEDAAPLAGGLSLGPMLNLRLARPAVVVDLARLGLTGVAVTSAKAGGRGHSNDRPDARLRRPDDEGSVVRTGALVRQALLKRRLASDLPMPLLADALDHVGHYQTRARGTLGGSLAHADPAAELPLCLATLGGSVRLESHAGARDVDAADFFDDALTTCRRPEELLTAICWPIAGEPGGAFAEFALRHGDFALVAAAAVVRRDATGRVIGLRLGFGGVEGAPRVFVADRAALAAPGDFVRQSVQALDATDDHIADSRYRKALAETLGRQVMSKARRRAEAGP